MKLTSTAAPRTRGRSIAKRVIPLLATILALLVTPLAVGAVAPSAVRATVAPPLARVYAGHTTIRPRPVLETPSKVAGGAGVVIVVRYHDFPADAKRAFQAAVNIWKRKINSSQRITIDATWKDLGPGLLGQAGASNWYRIGNKVYPVALAESICRCNINGSDVEIIAEFNSAFDLGGGWYFGTDGHPADNEWDLETIVLHEIGHGAGFQGTFDVQGSIGMYGLSDGVDTFKGPWDAHVWSAATGGLKLTRDVPNRSAEMKVQLTDRSVFFKGPNVLAVLGRRAKLFAPRTWQPGSSNQHFDEAAFPTGSPNGLMTPQIANGEVLHSPGRLTLALFRDIGWTTN